MAEPKVITAAHVQAALRLRYPTNAYAIAFEVRDATGFSATRAADCIAMSCWPSRGLSVIGHEIKVSRSDWVKERDSPSKAEAIARYCDEWWVCVSDAKIVKPGELPPTWGLLAMRGDKLAEVEKAKQPLEPIPLDRRFVAAFLRAVQKPATNAMDQLLWKARNEGEQRERDRSTREIERLKKDHAEFLSLVRQFADETGIDPLAPSIGGYSYKKTSVGEAVRILRGGLPDLGDKIEQLRRLARECERAAQECETVAKAQREFEEAQHG